MPSPLDDIRGGPRSGRTYRMIMGLSEGAAVIVPSEVVARHVANSIIEHRGADFRFTISVLPVRGSHDVEHLREHRYPLAVDHSFWEYSHLTYWLGRQVESMVEENNARHARAPSLRARCEDIFARERARREEHQRHAVAAMAALPPAQLDPVAVARIMNIPEEFISAPRAPRTAPPSFPVPPARRRGESLYNGPEDEDL